MKSIINRTSRDDEDRRWVFAGTTAGNAAMTTGPSTVAVGGGGGSGGGGELSPASTSRFSSNSIGDYEMPSYASSSGYSHNTYHGQVRHYRTPLNLDPKPLRFTDNPQLYTALAASATGAPAASANNVPFPSSSIVAPNQRRRSSNTSNDSEVFQTFRRIFIHIVRFFSFFIYQSETIYNGLLQIRELY